MTETGQKQDKNPQNQTKSDKKHLKLKQKKFLKAYIENLGNITEACEQAKIKSRGTYYEWLRNPLFKQALEGAIEHHNDQVYQRILRIALDNDKDMLKFWAKTQMKHRGFVEKQEIEHSGDMFNEVNINIVKPDGNNLQSNN